MEVSVLNIKGQETGRKVTLNEDIFGVEPNDHVIYLDVKQYLGNQRQGKGKKRAQGFYPQAWPSEGRRRRTSWRHQLSAAEGWWPRVRSETP